MYNKLFTKILDSSIWLAPDPHRLVWITFLAAMDEDGNAMFASAANVAARARVTREQAEAAIASFEAPDPDSGDPEHEGRRIERFPGGWHVLNAEKYRLLVTKAVQREQTRIRVARHRERLKASAKPDVTPDVTHEKRSSNGSVTPSEALSEADSVAKATGAAAPAETIFALGIPMLTAAGVAERNARSFLGLLRKHNPDPEVIAALKRCADTRAVSPIEFLQGVLRVSNTTPKESPHERQKRELAEKWMGSAAQNVIDMEVPNAGKRALGR